ncbi:MAG: tetratricopeptide repeat protein [Bryobacteraceae bacterium]|nr:tetratricopeptide repeat protein [Bryobacteraceae bacterium]
MMLATPQLTQRPTWVEDRQLDSPAWHRMAAETHYRQGRVEQAIDHLQRAIRLAPDSEQYYLDLGQVLSESNARTAVVAVFEAARKILPASFRIRSALAVAYLKVRDFEKARNMFLDLLESAPNDESLLSLLAECYDISSDWENAASIAARLRAQSSRNSAGWYYGAKAEYELRRQQGWSLETALEYTRRALQLGPDDWRSHLLLGKLLAETNEDEQAVAAFQKAIALNQQNPNAYYLLARALQRLGRNKDSAEAFRAYRRAKAAQADSQRRLVVEVR